MSVSDCRETTANGITLRLWDDGDRQTTREIAARLPRGCDAVEHVVTSVIEGEAILWLQTDDGETTSVVPEDHGLTVGRITTIENGSVAVRVRLAE